MTARTPEATGPAREAGPSRNSLYQKLKPGPGHSADEVIANQRTRLRGAMVELVAESGYRAATVRELSRLAGVSTRTFYDRFKNVEDCFASTCAWIMRDAIRRASEIEGGGEERLRAHLRLLLQTFADHPKAGRLVLVSSFEVGPAMAETARCGIQPFERLLCEDFGQELAPAPTRVIQGIVAAALHVARTRLEENDADGIPGAAEELSDWACSLRDRCLHERISELTGARQVHGSRHQHRAVAPCTVGDERERILAAVAKLGMSHGYEELRIPGIRSEAGVSRRSFDAQFNTVDECFIEMIESLVRGAAARAEKVGVMASSWETGVVRTIDALMFEISRDPTLAKLGFMDILAPGIAGLRCRERLISQWVDLVLGTVPPQFRPTRLVAEASMAAAWKMVHAEVMAGRANHVGKLAPAVGVVILAPVIGAEAAASAVTAERSP